MCVTDENLIRQHLKAYSLEELWSIADSRFNFSDDTPDEMIRRHHIERRIAAELTGYDEFYERRSPPLPADPKWVMGRENTQSFEWLRSNYSGVAAYFLWAGVAPSQFTLMQVARFELWHHLDKVLTAAHQAGEPVGDWRELGIELLEVAIREHLAARRAREKASSSGQ